MKSAASFRRMFVILLLTGAVAATARAGGFSEPTSAVPYGRALREARMVAAGKPGAWVTRIEGTSMLPFFGPDCILVVKPARLAQLRVGMIVVYVNRFGETAAHRVVEREKNGWRVRGFNNDRADSTLVDARNLRGVVYATFYSNGARMGLLASAAGLNRLPVALAAPAR